MSLRVMVVDDQPLVRAGFRMILDAEPDIEMVAEAGDGADAVEQARRVRPDVVLMDIQMPVMDGLEATRRLAGPETLRPIKVIVLTTFDLDEYVHTALRAGASGFLLKDVEPATLLDGIRVVARGDALLAPSMTRRLLERFAQEPLGSRQDSTEALSSLSPREREVLVLVADGLSNAEIAHALVVSEATAKTHVSHVLSKLGLRDRVHAVIRAYEVGLVRPGGA